MRDGDSPNVNISKEERVDVKERPLYMRKCATSKKRESKRETETETETIALENERRKYIEG